MTNLDRAKDVIRTRVKVGWDEEYLALGAIRLGSRRARRTRRIAFVSAIASCAALLMAFGWHRGEHVPGEPAVAVAPAPSPPSNALASNTPERALRFSDGSMVIPANDQTRVAIADDTPSRMTAVLTAGRSRFEVVPSPSRMFVVRAGVVTVIVIGTSFTVERQEHGVDVSVEHGRVRVESPSGYEELGPGESTTVQSSVRSREDADAAPSSLSQGAPKARAASDLATWRALAESRRFQEAYRWLPQASPSIETSQDLLLAADSARLSGHPEAAVKYLAKVVRQYPKDFSAQLAAFSLGSIYLDQLNRPADAAFRFGQARALAGTGALSEDALARQLEALARSGETSQAHDLAKEYVRLFPGGRHVDVARKLGGLD